MLILKSLILLNIRMPDSHFKLIEALCEKFDIRDSIIQHIDFEKWEEEALELVDQAVEFAEEADEPELSDLWNNVLAD